LYSINPDFRRDLHQQFLISEGFGEKKPSEGSFLPRKDYESSKEEQSVDSTGREEQSVDSTGGSSEAGSICSVIERECEHERNLEGSDAYDSNYSNVSRAFKPRAGVFASDEGENTRLERIWKANKHGKPLPLRDFWFYQPEFYNIHLSLSTNDIFERIQLIDQMAQERIVKLRPWMEQLRTNPVNDAVKRIFEGMGKNFKFVSKNLYGAGGTYFAQSLPADQENLFFAYKKRLLADKGKSLADIDRLLADKGKSLADMDRLLADKGKLLADIDRSLAEKESSLADKLIVSVDLEGACEPYNSKGYAGILHDVESFWPSPEVIPPLKEIVRRVASYYIAHHLGFSSVLVPTVLVELKRSASSSIIFNSIIDRLDPRDPSFEALLSIKPSDTRLCAIQEEIGEASTLFDFMVDVLNSEKDAIKNWMGSGVTEPVALANVLTTKISLRNYQLVCLWMLISGECDGHKKNVLITKKIVNKDDDVEHHMTKIDEGWTWPIFNRGFKNNFFDSIAYAKLPVLEEFRQLILKINRDEVTQFLEKFDLEETVKATSDRIDFLKGLIGQFPTISMGELKVIWDHFDVLKDLFSTSPHISLDELIAKIARIEAEEKARIEAEENEEELTD